MTGIQPHPGLSRDTQSEPTEQPVGQPPQSSPSLETPGRPLATPPQQQPSTQVAELATQPPQASRHQEAARRSAADVWKLKDLEWPPDDETRPVVRIITQNENGPCGLIALCELGTSWSYNL
jgi:hypothetical protein